MQRPPAISPKDQAASLRRAAEAATGADRAYYLWLAAEWDKAEQRQQEAAKTPAATPGSRRRTVTTG